MPAPVTCAHGQLAGTTPPVVAPARRLRLVLHDAAAASKSKVSKVEFRSSGGELADTLIRAKLTYVRWLYKCDTSSWAAATAVARFDRLSSARRC